MKPDKAKILQPIHDILDDLYANIHVEVEQVQLIYDFAHLSTSRTV